MFTTLQQIMESCSYGNLCAALPTATKTTTNITKTSDDDDDDDHNSFIEKRCAELCRVVQSRNLSEYIGIYQNI